MKVLKITLTQKDIEKLCEEPPGVKYLGKVSVRREDQREDEATELLVALVVEQE